MSLRVHPIESIAPPSVDVFESSYVRPRRPVVLRGVVADWPALKRWSLEHLRDTCGSCLVTTVRTDDGRVLMNGATGAEEERLPLGELVDSIRAGSRERYLTSRLHELPEELRRDVPMPAYCRDARWNNSNLWIGAEGNIACLHRDLADNLHALVSGHKRVTLVAPRQSSLVYPNSVFDTFPNGCHVDIENPDLERFPKLRGVEKLMADLYPGDAVYIPRRWWHHVRTLDLTVSVNFWWASGLQRAIVLTADTIKRVRGINR